jgi:hypothetical protein
MNSDEIGGLFVIVDFDLFPCGQLVDPIISPPWDRLFFDIKAVLNIH